MTLLVVAYAAVAAALLLSWFVSLERRDRHEVVFGVVVGILLLEVVVSGSQQEVPTGIFRLPFPVGGGLRTPDVLIPLALLARITTTDISRRVTATGLVWAAFVAWYAMAGVAGLLRGNPWEQVLFQGRAVLYLGGGYALAAGLRPDVLVGSRVIRTWSVVVGLVALTVLGVGVAVGGIAVSLPGLSLQEAGRLNPDAALMLPILGVVFLLVEASRWHRSLLVAVLAVLLVFAPLTDTRAGGILIMTAAFGLLTLPMLGSTWKRRIHATPTEALLFAGALAVVAIPAVAALASTGSFDPVGNVNEALFSESQTNTTEDRFELWRDARDDIRGNPVLGSGLGILHRLPKAWPLQDTETTAHNLFIDVTARSGLVGIGLFLTALGLTLRDALRAWRLHPNDQVAALAIACWVGILTYLAKAMVSSPFEKFRLAVTFGVLVGVVTAVTRSLAPVTRRSTAAGGAPDVRIPRARPFTPTV